jgi:predicted phage terminase large subunit-like protein
MRKSSTTQLREICTVNFEAFFRTCFSLLEPHNDLAWHDYLDTLCDAFQEFAKDNNRLLINLPPRVLKSTLMQIYCLWLWARKPETQIILASYDLKLTAEHTRRIRLILEHPEFNKIFPDLKIGLEDVVSKNIITNRHAGKIICCSIESGIIGHGCSVIMADDLNNYNKDLEEGYNEKVINYYQTLVTRLNDIEKGKILVIQQRTSLNDISAYLENNEEYKKIVIPASAMKSKFSDNALQKIRRETANNKFLSMYEQSPVPTINLFKNEFNYFIEDDKAFYVNGQQIPKTDCFKFGSCDLAITTKSNSDYTVVASFARTPDNKLLMTSLFRDRISSDKLINVITNVYRGNALDLLLVESVGFQIMVLEALKNECVVEEVKPGGKDKITRSVPLQIKMQNGQVLFKKDAPWMLEVVKELQTFPEGKHDDIVDCLAYAASWLNKYDVHTAPIVEVPLTAEEIEKRRIEEMWTSDRCWSRKY